MNTILASTIPVLGAGTFRLKGDDAYLSVLNALELGYRHIDTAQIYGNEQDVGRAIRDSGIKAKELFVTTKIWTEFLSKNKLKASLEQSLEKLQLDKVDLTLVHWPLPDAVPVQSYVEALAEAKQAGLTGLMGLSNFTIAQTKAAIDAVGVAEIATNQVEVHPFLQNRKLVEYSKEQGIQITAYMPLAYGKVLTEPLIQQIASEHQVTAAQVALAWSLQQGFVVIPSSTKRANLAQNLAAVELKLTAGNMNALSGLDRNERLANPDFAPDWD
ncbi:MAG TPA: 2,5-didehydrogluconate reductase DkgB [Rheinheimera sp.]|uniref:2,5-didehydrogluconate reductase DkgB n=1 Tax=Rheinheimera sp. TaxID=1869214 RepID=UPI002B49FA3B|nr:2,5-didehydrogluconate reductase DkgB [Rheinheimera sp.]HJS15205.1 2,5-didehydrogluconate reductase DkgB [Rheinheimera sp.]